MPRKAPGAKSAKGAKCEECGRQRGWPIPAGWRNDTGLPLRSVRGAKRAKGAEGMGVGLIGRAEERRLG